MDINRFIGVSNFKIIRHTFYFIKLSMVIIFAISAGLIFNMGCAGSRDSALSLVEETAPAVLPLTDFRYSSAKVARMNLKPIFNDNCARCHNPEAMADFPLNNYLQVYTRGVLVKRSVQPGGKMQKYIPYDYEMIMNWYDGGMPE